MIVPIFKNGIKDEPTNYRGLTIGSNICKLFTKILNIRLDKFCIKRQLIRNEQICFSKGKRTSDHSFVLKTLIDKYCQQNVCFHVLLISDVPLIQFVTMSFFS